MTRGLFITCFFAISCAFASDIREFDLKKRERGQSQVFKVILRSLATSQSLTGNLEPMSILSPDPLLPRDCVKLSNIGWQGGTHADTLKSMA